MKKFKVKFNLNGSQRETEVRSWSVNDAQKLVREQYGDRVTIHGVTEVKD